MGKSENKSHFSSEYPQLGMFSNRFLYPCLLLSILLLSAAKVTDISKVLLLTINLKQITTFSFLVFSHASVRPASDAWKTC